MEKWLVSYRFPLKQIHWSIECSGVNREPPSCAPRNTWSCLLAWQMGARPRRPRTGFPDVIVILIWWLLFCGLHVVSSIRKILNWHIPVDPFLFSMSTLKDHPVRKEPSDAEEREVEELQQLLLNAEMAPLSHRSRNFSCAVGQVTLG